MTTILQRVVIGAIAAVAVVYAGDWMWAKHLMSNPSAGLGSVQVQRETDIPRKDGRVEFNFDAPETETCIHSIFPHFGYTPCWYAERHTRIQN